MSSPIRQCGTGVPLFSIPSSVSWGIGEFTDLPAFGEWCAAAGQRFVQLLPLNEMSPGQTSPYSSMTAMALDPIYIHVPAVADFAALGGETGLTAEEQASLAEVRAAEAVSYAEVRALKSAVLRRAYQRFVDEEVARGTARAAAFAAYQSREAWWLDAYVMFRAVHAAHEEHAWWDWPPALAYADPAALAEAGDALTEERRYRAYLQWIAEEQWQAARAAAGVKVIGDLPFMISADSPDVWARRDEFMLDATVGVPPDAFSDTGQDWGLPPWRWDVMERTGFQWMRGRARRTAALFDGVRADHLVGLYRIYIRPLDDTLEKSFSPPEEPEQTRLGEMILGIYMQTGIQIVAEDLGTVPPFVRLSMARLAVPGFKVMRWEREWEIEGQPFIDPSAYPEVSVALSGTHDTESLAQWWREMEEDEREAFLALPQLAEAGLTVQAPFQPEVRDVLLRVLIGSASCLVMLPLQDIFGWDARINTPATVNALNWTWKVPIAVDRWRESPEWVERASALTAWCQASGRRVVTGSVTVWICNGVCHGHRRATPNDGDRDRPRYNSLP